VARGLSAASDIECEINLRPNKTIDTRHDSLVS
jgi:hypothetical protein